MTPLRVLAIALALPVALLMISCDVDDGSGDDDDVGAASQALTIGQIPADMALGLSTGKIYVRGVDAATGQQRAWLYDPATAAMTTTTVVTDSGYPVAISSGRLAQFARCDRYSTPRGVTIYTASSGGIATTPNNLPCASSRAELLWLSAGKVLVKGAMIADLDTGTTTSISGALGLRGSVLTKLANGKVLQTGGDSTAYLSPGPTTTISLIDPVALTRQSVAVLRVARSYHTATLLADGTILIVGGHNTAGELTPSVERYNPTTAHSSVVSSLGTGRDGHAAVTLSDGRVAIVGGREQVSGGYHTSTLVEVYAPLAADAGILRLLNDPATSNAVLTAGGATASVASALLAHRDGVDGIAMTSDDNLFDTLAEVSAVAGVNAPQIASLRVYASAHGYPSTAWATSVPLARSRIPEVVQLRPDGNVLVLGGSHDDTRVAPLTTGYDYLAGEVELLNPRLARASHGSAAQRSVSSALVQVQTVPRPQTSGTVSVTTRFRNQWLTLWNDLASTTTMTTLYGTATIAASPWLRSTPSIAVDTTRNRLVLFGGQKRAGFWFNDTWEFDGITWTERTPSGPLPAGRSIAPMVFNPSRAATYMLGGWNEGGGLVDMWKYNGTSWQAVSQANHPVTRWLGATYDPVVHRIVAVGSTASDVALYEFDDATAIWTRLVTLGLGANELPNLTYDTTAHNVVIANIPGDSSSAVSVFTWHRANVTLTGASFPNFVNSYGPRGAFYLASNDQLMLLDDYNVEEVRKTPRFGTPPAIATLRSQAVQAYPGQALYLTATASDVDGDAITWASGGLPGGATFVGGTFRWTPGASQAGVWQLRLIARAVDGEDSRAITVIVAAATSYTVLPAGIVEHQVHLEPTTSVVLEGLDEWGQWGVWARYASTHTPVLNCTFDGPNPGAVRYHCEGIALFWYAEGQWNFGEVWEGIVPPSGLIGGASRDGAVMRAQLAPDVGGDFKMTLTAWDGPWRNGGERLQLHLNAPITGFLDHR